MASFVERLQNILVSKWFAVVLISLLLSCLSIFPIANASAQTCGWNWDILSISGIKTNYHSGETISGNISFRLNNAANSSGIQQLLIGIIDLQNKVIDVKCVYNGVPKACPAWTTGTASFSLKTPVTPGNYKVIAADYFEYSCSDALNKFPSLCSSTSPYCKDITTITISAPPPPPNPFEDAWRKIQNSILHIRQTIGSIIQRIWHIIKTIVLPLAILVIIAMVVWRFRSHWTKIRLSIQKIFCGYGKYPSKEDLIRMGGAGFERYVKELLTKQGWTVKLLGGPKDRGIDLIAEKTEKLYGKTEMYIQCKNHGTPSTGEHVRNLNGALPHNKAGVKGVLICPSGFTQQAKDEANDHKIELWDYQYIYDLIKSSES